MKLTPSTKIYLTYFAYEMPFISATFGLMTSEYWRWTVLPFACYGIICTLQGRALERQDTEVKVKMRPLGFK